MADAQQYYDNENQICKAPPGADPDALVGDPVMLLGALNVPPEWAANLPEGELVNVENPATAASRGMTAGAAAMVAGDATLNKMLTTYGFTRQIPGGNSIGLVGYPRWFTPGARIPTGVPPGHTAAFVRLGGKLQVARGFVPESTLQTILKAQGIFSGTQGVPAVVQNDLLVFTNMGSRAIEWPVDAQAAIRFADSLPLPGTPPPGAPTLYTGRPQVFGVPAQATNCVGWACTEIENAFGGRVGTAGPNGQVDPLIEPANPQTGLQGRYMQTTKNPGAVAKLPGTGQPVVSSMPKYIQVIRWGGKVLILLGAGMVFYETYKAPEGQKGRTFTGAAGGFAGGLLGGAFAGSLMSGATIGAACGPGILLCGVVLGLGFGLLGYYGGRAVAEGAYDSLSR